MSISTGIGTFAARSVWRTLSTNRGVIESRTVIGDEHGVAALYRLQRRLLERLPHRRLNRLRHAAIDPNHLLLGGMDAAGEDAGLDRRRRLRHPQQVPRIDAAMQRRHDAPARDVAPDHRDESGAAAERRHVVGRVAGAARDDLGGVVLEDEHRCLARHARHPAVDEFVRDDVAHDDDLPVAKGVGERNELCGIQPGGLLYAVEDSSDVSAVYTRSGPIPFMHR